MGLDIGNLLEPISKMGVPKILFAGEATDPKYYGTVHAGNFYTTKINACSQTLIYMMQHMPVVNVKLNG